MIRHITLALSLLFLGCATDYGPQSFTGGYSDYLTVREREVENRKKDAIKAAQHGVFSVFRQGEQAAISTKSTTILG